MIPQIQVLPTIMLYGWDPLQNQAMNRLVLYPMQKQTANCTLNVLKAHAAAVKEFRKIVPGGKIAMNLNSDWYYPLDENSEQDKARFAPMTSLALALSHT